MKPCAQVTYFTLITAAAAAVTSLLEGSSAATESTDLGLKTFLTKCLSIRQAQWCFIVFISQTTLHNSYLCKLHMHSILYTGMMQHAQEGMHTSYTNTTLYSARDFGICRGWWGPGVDTSHTHISEMMELSFGVIKYLVQVCTYVSGIGNQVSMT